MPGRERKERKKEEEGGLWQSLSLSLSLSARDWSSESTDLILILYSPLSSHGRGGGATVVATRKEEKGGRERIEIKCNGTIIIAAGARQSRPILPFPLSPTINLLFYFFSHPTKWWRARDPWHPCVKLSAEKEEKKRERERERETEKLAARSSGREKRKSRDQKKTPKCASPPPLFALIKDALSSPPPPFVLSRKLLIKNGCFSSPVVARGMGGGGNGWLVLSFACMGFRHDTPSPPPPAFVFSPIYFFFFSCRWAGRRA